MFFSNIMQTIIILLLGAIIGGCLYHYNLKNTISLNLDFFKTDQTLLNNIASHWVKLIKFIMEKINI